LTQTTTWIFWHLEQHDGWLRLLDELRGEVAASG